MFGKTILGSIRRAAVQFVDAKQGNVAVLFAIALVPLLALVGTAVDYTRANAARSAIQSALDTTALMISKDASSNPSLSPDDIQSLATKYFGALYHNPDAPTVTIKATFAANSGNIGSTVSIVGSSTMPTDFMKVVNIPQIDIGASTKTAWGNARMRVAMVLDNTGSMADDGKMPALQTASKALIDQLSKLAKTSGDVYISIIPFAKDVNVGKSNYNQFWVKWSGQSDTWDENNGSCSAGSSYKTKSTCIAKGSCSISGKNSQGTCTSAGTCSNSSYTTSSSCTSAMVCSKSQYTTQNKCTNNNGTWALAKYTWTAGVWTPATWTANNHTTWNGCVTDRDQDYDTLSTVPISGDNGTPSTLFAAEQWSSCPVQLMPMSYDWTTLKSKIDAMAPAGNTNQSIGLAWGWLSLNQTDPLNSPAKDSNYTYRDAIILLTDGLNTQNRTSSSASAIDARQKILCDNIKGIIDPKTNQPQYTIYTIQVNTSSPADPTQAVLQNCASSSDKFYMLTKADQIVAAFDSIGTSLSKLRLAQ